MIKGKKESEKNCQVKNIKIDFILRKNMRLQLPFSGLVLYFYSLRLCR